MFKQLGVITLLTLLINGLPMLAEEAHPMPVIDAAAIAQTADTKTAEDWTQIGQRFLQQKEYTKALAAFNRALQLEVGHSEAWAGRGDALYGLGRIAEAIAAHRQAINLNPSLAVVWTRLGGTLNRTGRLRATMATYQRTLQTTPAWMQEYRCS